MLADAVKNVDENGRPYTKTSPISGFKNELVNNGQGGDVYHHILYMAGSILTGNPFLVAALPISDATQVMRGRKESVTELRDDVAGIAAGKAMIAGANSGKFDWLKNRLKGELCTGK